MEGMAGEMVEWRGTTTTITDYDTVGAASDSVEA